jgi:hypothetical protein
MDDACLETQTKPSTADELSKGPISTILNRHVFEISQTLSLEVDSTVRGGSGHISVDSQTAFGGSATLFLAFYQALQENSTAWAEFFHGDNVKDQYDRLNSPWLRDLDPKKADRSAKTGFAQLMKLYPEWIASARGGAMSIEDAVTKMNTLVFSLTNSEWNKEDQSRVKNLTSNPVHYQAVNFEHMTEPEQADRRLELRDVPAQKDLNTLKVQLARIVEFIEMSRASVRQRR